MNPLLNRLFEDRSKSKTKRFSVHRQDHHSSVDKALVPKIPTKVRLESLAQPFNDKQKSKVQRVYVGRLPTLNLKTQQQKTQQLKQQNISRPNFRNRKFSTSIKDAQTHFFSTEFEDPLMMTAIQVPEKLAKVQQKIKPFQTQVQQAQGKQNEQELFQYLKVIENNEELNDEFCYMNRRQQPYSFYIVDYEDRNKDEYLTVSLRGITYFKDEESEFYSLRKFSKEVQQFKQIKKIKFFQDYIKIKAMLHWKEKMIRKKFNLKCKFITNHLFSQNMTIQQYLHYIHALSEDYSAGSFFNFTISITQTLKQFKMASQEGGRELVKSIKKYDHLIEKQLTLTLQILMDKFKAEERVNLKSADQKQKDTPYLPFDAKRRSMKYTQMAKLKDFESMIYKLIKYTDMLRFNTKIIIIRRCYQNSIQELKNLKKAFQNKDTIRFTNWIHVDVGLHQVEDRARIQIQPPLQEIISCVGQLKDQILREIFREHRLLAQKKNQMYCEDLEFNQDEQHPTKFELKYFILKNSEFEYLQALFNHSLKEIQQEILNLFSKYNKDLLAIYNKNSLKTSIEKYLENTAILQYLTTYREEYTMIHSLQEIVEFALVVLNISKLKQRIRKSAEDKYKAICNSVPNQIIKRCEQIQVQVRNIATLFKENPYTAEQYILFTRNYHQNKHKIPSIQSKMYQLLQFEEIVYKYGIRVGQTAKISINQCQTYFKELSKRFEEIDSNQQSERKKFENIVDQMIPTIEQKSEEMLKEIHVDSFINNHNTQIKAALLRVKDLNSQFLKIKEKKEQLFRYQRQMGLGHKQLQVFGKLQLSIQYLQEVWQAREYYLSYYKFMQTAGYGNIHQRSLQPINRFIAHCDNYSILQCYQLLQEFKQQTLDFLKILKIGQLLSAQTLQQEHLQSMKAIIKSTINIDYIFSKDGRAKITCEQLFKQTNANQVQQEISQIVFLSAQESIVKTQLLQIEEYWKKTKLKLVSEDLAQNQVQVAHLDINQQIQQKIGFYVVTLKNIEGSSHIVGIAKERAMVNAKICTYVLDFLAKWWAVQKQWISLLPLMTNCPAVKHQSNVYFDFTSVDSSIRRLIRYVSEMSSLKKICDDYEQGRYMSIVKECQEQLKQINITFNQFLQSKRTTYGRFYFVSDYELINILEYVKDARTASKYIASCFNCTQLQLDNELMAGFAHKNEIFKVRKTILKGETQQIFKSIEQTMRNSMKLSIKSLMPKLKVSPSISTEIQENTMQVILVCDRIFWTEMSQLYLNTTSYPQYKLLFTSIANQMAELIGKIDMKYWHKLSLRYVQMATLKDIALQLIRDQINIHDFKWKQQIRIYMSEEDIGVHQFQSKLIYGCEYYPQGEITVQTTSSLRFLYETFHSCIFNRTLLVSGQQGQGKRHLIYEAGAYFGAFQRELVCNSRLSEQSIVKLVQGAIVSGAWLTFYEFNALSYSVFAQLLFALNKANSVDYRPQQYLFMLVHQHMQYQQISLYSFNHFAVYEPDKQKISQYLMQVCCFKQSQELSTKILRYIKLIRPFLNKIIGSQLQLIRRIVANAGRKQLETRSQDKQNIWVYQAIKQEIILKQSESKRQILYKALSSFFEQQQQIVQRDETYQEKVQAFTAMLQEGISNIIVLGQRSCKTTLIKQSIALNKKQPFYLFGETTDNFFSPSAMQSLRSIKKDKIVVYDSNKAIDQWVDLITSGYLFIEGKKLILRNQIIMEFRNINHISPSFIAKATILYLPQTIVSKWNKFNHLISKDHANYRNIQNNLSQLCGPNLENITDNNLTILAKILASLKEGIPSKNMHKIIVWILSLIDKESMWNRHYGGKHQDFTLNSSQLIALDTNKIQHVFHPNYENYLVIPTKKIAQSLDLIHLLHQLNVQVHLEGPPQSGKSTLLMFISNPYSLNSKKTTHQWGEYIKNKYTCIRKQGKNLLVDLEKEGHTIIIDDVDLGLPYHYQYLRVLVENSTFRDKHFHEYSLQACKIIACSREQKRQGKYWTNVSILPIKQLSKEPIQSIYQANLTHQITQFSMNKEVQELMQGSMIRGINILHDDLANIFGVNSSSALLLALLRNLLSLPKRQAYISSKAYYSFFKTMCVLKLQERNIFSHSQWKIKGVYQNMFKVIFGQKTFNLQQKVMHSEGQFKALSMQQLKQKIQPLFPQIICFDKLLFNVLFLVNQLKCLDNNVIVLGKKGVGKKVILEICAKLIGAPIYSNISQAIIAAIKSQKVLLLDLLDKEQSFYEKVSNCQSDKELQMLVAFERKQQFRSRAAGEQLSESKMVDRCKKNIMFALVGDASSYQPLMVRKRQCLSMPICLVQEWPTSALLNIYSSQDQLSNIHAEIFLAINKIMTNSRLPSYSLKSYQRYVKLYNELYSKLLGESSSKLQLHTNIHFKFNQSCQMISAWENRVQVLRQQIEETIKASNQIIAANQLSTADLSTFYSQIKAQEEQSAIKTYELKNITAQVDKKIVLMEKVLKKIEKIVSSFQRTQLGQFKKIYKLNKLIYFGAQCLCILLKEEQTDEKTINRILADSNLLMKMKAPQILKERNPRLQSKLKKEFSSTLLAEMKINSNELAKTLIEWLNSIVQYWQTSSDLKEEEEKQAILKQALSQSSTKYKSLQQQVKQTQNSIQQKLAIIRQHSAIKQAKELEYNSISLKLSNAAKIIPILQRELQQTKQIIKEIRLYQEYLKGNTILAAFTGVFLPLKPLQIKQRLIDTAKSALRKNIIAFSPHFMAQLSQEKLDSLQSLNYFLITSTSFPKLVIDPLRKFTTYLQVNAPQQIRQSILEVAEAGLFEQGKIYHTTSIPTNMKQGALVIDWSALALEQKDAVFLKIATSQKPQYFQVKNELQIQINRNIRKVATIKEQLFQTICERSIKIIDDQSFVQHGQSLQKLQQQTHSLKLQAEQKISQIEQLSASINDDVDKIIRTLNIVKHFRKVDLQLILDICSKQGNPIQNFIRWSLANIKPHHRTNFLLALIMSFQKQQGNIMLKEIINKVPLKVVQTKLKKPQMISNKHWEVILKLSVYTPNFKKLMQNAIKFQNEFQQWCIDPISHVIPEQMGVKLQLIETWMLIQQLKPKVIGHLIYSMIPSQLQYNLSPKPNKSVIEMMDTKFPILIQNKLESIIKYGKQMNDSRYTLVRVSKIRGQVQMKKLIWKSMEAGEWFICYDVHTKEHIHMLQNICEYVMKYDKQPNFRVIVALDSFIHPQSQTILQNLIKASLFLQSNSVHLYEQQISASKWIQQFPMQYQLTKNHTFSNKEIFNKMFKLIVICFTVLRRKYPQLQCLAFKRIMEPLQLIKFKNIVVQFNVFTIVHYITNIITHSLADITKRRQIQQLCEYIIDQSKMAQQIVHGIPLHQENCDQFIINNSKLVGCNISSQIREQGEKFKETEQLLNRIFKLHPTQEEVLALVRMQLGRVPGQISNKELKNTFNYYLQEQIRVHNKKCSSIRKALEQLNQPTQTTFPQQNFANQYDRIHRILSRIGNTISVSLDTTNFKEEIANYISRIRKEHDFLLYFNPTLPVLMVHPKCVSHLQMLLSTFAIHQMQAKRIKNGYKWLTYIQFTSFAHQKELISSVEGFFLPELTSQQFMFNREVETIDPSFEIDGLQTCPLVKVLLKQESSNQEDERENIEINIQDAEVNIQCKGVYKEWGLRNPKILII